MRIRRYDPKRLAASNGGPSKPPNVSKEDLHKPKPSYSLPPEPTDVPFYMKHRVPATSGVVPHSSTAPNSKLWRAPEDFELKDNIKKGRKYTKSSVARLESLGFDPIERLVDLYLDISRQIAVQEELQQASKVRFDGSVLKYSAMTHAALLSTQQKLLNDLMRYGYARVSETVTVNTDDVPKMVINLTPTGGTFQVDSVAHDLATTDSVDAVESMNSETSYE